MVTPFKPSLFNPSTRPPTLLWLRLLFKKIVTTPLPFLTNFFKKSQKRWNISNKKNYHFSTTELFKFTILNEKISNVQNASFWFLSHSLARLWLAKWQINIYVGGIFPYIPIIKTTIYVNAHGFFNSNVPEIWPTEIAWDSLKTVLQKK